MSDRVLCASCLKGHGVVGGTCSSCEAEIAELPAKAEDLMDALMRSVEEARAATRAARERNRETKGDA